MEKKLKIKTDHSLHSNSTRLISYFLFRFFFKMFKLKTAPPPTIRSHLLRVYASVGIAILASATVLVLAVNLVIEPYVAMIVGFLG